jgi:hypothetical protein
LFVVATTTGGGKINGIPGEHSKMAKEEAQTTTPLPRIIKETTTKY